VSSSYKKYLHKGKIIYESRKLAIQIILSNLLTSFNTYTETREALHELPLLLNNFTDINENTDFETCIIVDKAI
jgi:hypothetical protein